MSKKNGISMNLPSVDDIFTTQEERDDSERELVKDIPIAEISDFPNHPFKVKMDENMTEMIDSIRKRGVLLPAVVREKPGGGYEMVSGHRRKFASEMAERTEMPCIIRNMTDDEAILVMVDSNLQREKILPSEKAFAYKMKLEAMKRQAGRPKNNSAPVGQNFGQTSREILAEKSPDSHSQIQRYIRLTELIPPILDMVDDNLIAMRPAVELSYLPKDKQEILLDAMQAQDCTPSHAQAIKLRRCADENRLNEDVIHLILSEEKPNQVEQFRIPRKRIDRYFPQGTSTKEMEETIVKALDEYRQRHKERNKNRDRER